MAEIEEACAKCFKGDEKNIYLVSPGIFLWSMFDKVELSRSVAMLGKYCSDGMIVLQQLGSAGSCIPNHGKMRFSEA